MSAQIATSEDSTIDWSRFLAMVASNQRFVLTSHIRPDCDALGSELGMARVLEALGKEVMIANAHETPGNLAFVDPTRRIQVLGKTVAEAGVATHDMAIVLDTSAWIQLGDMAGVFQRFPGRKAVIDHHVSEDDLGAEWFKDVTAEATGRLVVEAADALGVSLTPEMATPLFAALATDTGWFRFDSTRSKTFHLAARLLDAGAKPSALYNQLYEQDSAGRVRLRGMILARMETELDGRLVHTFARAEDYPAAGASPTDTEDVVNETLTVKGTEFAVIFVGLVQGGYKVSFRSRCSVDCSRVARAFGGGGHRAAAGATLSGSLEDVRSQVLTVVRSALSAAPDAQTEETPSAS